MGVGVLAAGAGAGVEAARPVGAVVHLDAVGHPVVAVGPQVEEEAQAAGHPAAVAGVRLAAADPPAVEVAVPPVSRRTVCSSSAP